MLRPSWVAAMAVGLVMAACAAPVGGALERGIAAQEMIPDDTLAPDWSTVPASATASGRPARPLECRDAVVVDPTREVLLRPLVYEMRIPPRALTGNTAWIRPDAARSRNGRHQPFLRVGGSAVAAGEAVYLTLGYSGCEIGGEPVDPDRVAVYRFRGSRFVDRHDPISHDRQTRTVTVAVRGYTKYAVGSN
jgi:hypothetical protein